MNEQRRISIKEWLETAPEPIKYCITDDKAFLDEGTGKCITDNFCFQYQPTAQQAKQALSNLAQMPKQDGRQKAGITESNANQKIYQRKYSPALMNDVYVLRDQGKTCVEIAPIVSKLHSLRLSTGSIAAILAWRNRGAKEKTSAKNAAG
ncbi:MAG: hypothetical protein QXR48_01860 [Candidatus Woesearchaeota archaeon]